MSAAQAIQAARAAGINLLIENGRVVLDAPADLPAALLDVLRRHKPEITRLLSPSSEWKPEDYRVYFEERAALLEYESHEGMPNGLHLNAVSASGSTEILSRPATPIAAALSAMGTKA